jgi:hypothetical protein
VRLVGQWWRILVAERGGRGIADRQIIVDDSRLAAMFELGFSRRCNKAAGAASGVGVARGAGEGGGGAGGRELE